MTFKDALLLTGDRHQRKKKSLREINFVRDGQQEKQQQEQHYAPIPE